MNKIILIIVVLVVIVGGYWVFTGSPEKESEPTVIPNTTLKVPASGAGDVDETIAVQDGEAIDEINEITVISTEFAFSPSNITVQAGQQVVINFKNQGNVPHDLVIEGLGVRSALISGGQTDSIEFIAPSVGTYTIFCSVGTHRLLGMEGNLEIE